MKPLYARYFPIITVIFLIISFIDIPASDIVDLFRTRKNKQFEKEVVEIAKSTLEAYIENGTKMMPSSDIPEELKLQAGVIVTLSMNGKVRGCMGTLFPKEKNIAEEIARSTILAATMDQRYPPVERHELEEIDYCISIIGKLKRVYSRNELKPLELGLLVRAGKKSALLLPGEARTIDWQIAECKRMAKIPQNQEVEMFIFETVTFED